MPRQTISELSELPDLAKKMLRSFDGQKVALFYGEMGAGKTTIIKALCEELGVKDAISSPTYSIVNEYRGVNGQKIYHFDFYRINSQDEVYDLGYEEYFYSGAYCFIEWPEKIGDLIPLEHETITIKKEGETRVVTF